MKPIISGIQQIGIGVSDVQEAFAWYRKHFGMRVKVFEEAAEANLMLPYTGGKPHNRHAIFSLNLRGGGGFEIWQYTSRTPEDPTFEIHTGDLGMFICKVKCPDVHKTYSVLKEAGVQLLGEVETDPNGAPHCYLKDPYGNIFELVSNQECFSKYASISTGGAAGAVMGVSDMDKSLPFYRELLGYDQIVYDRSGHFDDLRQLPGGLSTFRRVLLRHSKPRVGSFARLFGSSEIELIQVLDRKPRRIFENRYWGDHGFIHLCFDINGMEHLKQRCEKLGHPFTVDSSKSFDMGEAAGHFSYVEDPDGSLIEFVETHRIPVIKKLGWYIDLRKRNPEKSLPDWMLKAFRFNTVKD